MMTESATGMPRNDATGEMAMLRGMVRQAVADARGEWPDDAWSTSWSTDWSELSDLGLWSTLSEPDGSLAAAVVVSEELGRQLYPGPAIETMVAERILSEMRSELTDAWASTAFATMPALFAWGEVSVGAGNSGDGVVATGRLGSLVAPAADSLLIAPTEDGGLAFIRTSAASPIMDRVPIDISRSMTRFDAHESAAVVIGDRGKLVAQSHHALALLYCADTLGGINRVIERTVEYASQRETFGAAIGANQAVAHRLVDHTITLRQMQLLLDDAVLAFDADESDVAVRVAAAEVFIADRAADLVSDCVQLSGAIGFTWEFGHHFFLRRATQNAAIAGRAGGARARLAQLSDW